MSLAAIASFGFDEINTLEVLKMYHAMGCITCQYYRNQDNPPQLKDVVQITQDAGLKIDSIHALFGFSPQYDLSNPDHNARTQTVSLFKQEAHLAAELNGSAIVIHPSHTLPKNESPDPTQTESRIKALIESLQDLTTTAEQLNVTFLLENQPGNALLGNTTNEIAQIIRAVNHPRIKMCLDTGHAHITDNVLHAVSENIDLIQYIHIHDNDKHTDSHDIPTSGTIPWSDFAEQLKLFDTLVPCMLEVFYPPEKMKHYLTPHFTTQLKNWFN